MLVKIGINSGKILRVGIRIMITGTNKVCANCNMKKQATLREYRL